MNRHCFSAVMILLAFTCNKSVAANTSSSAQTNTTIVSKKTAPVKAPVKNSIAAAAVPAAIMTARQPQPIEINGVLYTPVQIAHPPQYALPAWMPSMAYPPMQAPVASTVFSANNGSADAATAHYQYGISYLNMGNLPEARRQFQIASYIDPTSDAGRSAQQAVGNLVLTRASMRGEVDPYSVSPAVASSATVNTAISNAEQQAAQTHGGLRRFVSKRAVDTLAAQLVGQNEPSGLTVVPQGSNLYVRNYVPVNNTTSP